MRNRFLLMLGSILLTLSSFAKAPDASISGTVNDENQKAVAAATIQLLNAADSQLVKTELTNEQGAYEFLSLNEGKYFLKVSAIGNVVFKSEVITLTPGESHKMPVIALEHEAAELGEVVVKAKKPLIEVKADKTVFNVEQSINATGSNALELLQKSPGVQVDNNENISMKGRTGVRIYVDGRMMQLDSKSLADYLKSINSNDIEAIEMITNPSAKYDASGNAGIINIRLKKNKRYGTNGSVNVGYIQGITPKGNGSVNLNYRDKNINLFGNAGVMQGKYENGLDLYRVQNDTLFDQITRRQSLRKSFNAKVGADYFINSKNTFGFIADVNTMDVKMVNKSNTEITYRPQNKFEKTLEAFNSLDVYRTNANFNLNYRYADTSGKEINFDGDYGLFRGAGRSYQPNNYYAPDGSLISSFVYRNYTPTDIDIYTAKLDVQQKLLQGMFGYGAKFSYVTTQNTFAFYRDKDQKPELDLKRSNDFKYIENVNAAYVNYQRQFGTKWGLQAGLRAEQTNSEGDLTRRDGQQQEDDNVKRHYFNLFPSAALTYNMSEKHALNLTYSRRIDRPSYQSLNPFENKLDELTYEKGNAFLRPQYTNSIELTHTFMGMLNTTLGYSHVKDYATQVTDTTNSNATYVQEQNLATQQLYSINISSPFKVTKWWSGYANIWYNYQHFNGKINDKVLDRGYSMYGAYMQNAITIGKKGTKAEVTGFLNGPSVWGGTWKTKTLGGLDLGVQQPLLKNKASVRVSVTDVFHTNPWKAESNFGGLLIRGSNNQESTTFRVSFNYRFGSNDIKQSRQRKTGLESEANRIK